MSNTMLSNYATDPHYFPCNNMTLLCGTAVLACVQTDTCKRPSHGLHMFGIDQQKGRKLYIHLQALPFTWKVTRKGDLR
jgi:hypothetical protein